MRLKQRINEESNLDKLVDVLYSVIGDCQPFLKELGTVKPPQFLYSGRKTEDPWFEKDVRTDRRPTDTFIELHKDLDEAFNKKFGWKPRSNGLFCTGYLNDATDYGTAYTIFPKGPFKIIWSRSIGDLYLRLSDMTTGMSTSAKHENGIFKIFLDNTTYSNKYNKVPLTPEQIKEKVHEEYHKYINGIVGEYRDDKIMHAIGSHSEIMLNCKSYYAIKWHLYNNELRDFFKHYKNNYNMSKDEIRYIIAYNGEQ